MSNGEPDQRIRPAAPPLTTGITARPRADADRVKQTVTCDNCGRRVPAGYTVHTTKSEQIGTGGPYGAPTKTVRVTLCEYCAHHRERWVNWLFFGFLIFGAIVLLSYLWK